MKVEEQILTLAQHTQNLTALLISSTGLLQSQPQAILDPAVRSLLEQLSFIPARIEAPFLEIRQAVEASYDLSCSYQSLQQAVDHTSTVIHTTSHKICGLKLAVDGYKRDDDAT